MAKAIKSTNGTYNGQARAAAALAFKCLIIIDAYLRNWAGFRQVSACRPLVPTSIAGLGPRVVGYRELKHQVAGFAQLTQLWEQDILDRPASVQALPVVETPIERR